ncbi:MAG TPA: RnfH family protein [Steroidobacteraceae bacterium]|nr:RnfH family protein [Steroidobacteraceae bacterium]
MSAPAPQGRRDGKRCCVAYATRERQYLWTVELPPSASIADALSAARALAGDEAVPWDSAAVGIFGEPRQRSDPCADGDRIELYRPLRRDPRERRRERAQRERGKGRAGY